MVCPQHVYRNNDKAEAGIMWVLYPYTIISIYIIRAYLDLQQVKLVTEDISSMICVCDFKKDTNLAAHALGGDLCTASFSRHASLENLTARQYVSSRAARVAARETIQKVPHAAAIPRTHERSQLIVKFALEIDNKMHARRHEA